MIRPLRRRHFVMVCALALLLPVGFVAGLLARPGEPEPVERPETGDAVVETGHLVWESAGMWGELPIVTRRWAGGPPPGGNSIELDVREDLRRPDLLCYWVFAGMEEGERLPADAHLLGSVGGTGSHLFEAVPGRPDTGHLVLYSLAHQEVVGRASVEDVVADPVPGRDE